MAAGIADDLATTLILATDKPVMAVPAMNVKMWLHDATRRNVAWLREAGVEVMEPDEGPMACGEFGPGRLPEPEVVWAEIAARFGIAADCEPEPDLLQALEPEAEVEVEAKSGSSLGSLLSSLIPRKTPKREPVEFVEEEEEVAEEAFVDGEFITDSDVEILPEPDLDAPIMAKKGKAKAAPPTDAEALNHTVVTGAGDQLPEIIGELAADPLAYQPDFDIDPKHRPLFGRHVLVTAGPTHEPIDPVRYIANRSSGKQGFAIAAAAAALGARVTLVAGPVTLATPPGVDRIDVISAREMADAVKKALPVDAAVMVAAVADWRSKEYASEKMKKRGSAPPALLLTENPDILAQVASGKQRPKLLIGFAAETEDVIENAKIKRKRKAADWIIANDVTAVDGKGVMGGDANAVHIVTGEGVEDLPEMPKEQVALAIAEKMALALDEIDPRDA
jgi:phosphopantothenoylcysteine decarboxylase/phosphopantothenate--cysteine ligase